MAARRCLGKSATRAGRRLVPLDLAFRSGDLKPPCDDDDAVTGRDRADAAPEVRTRRRGALQGAPFAREAAPAIESFFVSIDPAVVLQGTRESMIDMLEDDLDVALQFLSTLSGLLLARWDSKAEGEAMASKRVSTDTAA